MYIKELNKTEVAEIYHQYMVNDFPKDELKPLAMILKAMDDGIYDCLAIMDEEELCGYAFFVRSENDYLFDYLAILEQKRNAGIGSTFIALLSDYYKDADSIIGEVEDYELEEDPAAASLQKRRYYFYMRNGYLDTTVHARTFGVDFIILEVPLKNSPHTPEVIRALYEKLYRTILPAKMYEKNIVIK